MSVTSVSALRDRLNLDHALDDAMLAQMLEAAEAHVVNVIGAAIPLTFAPVDPDAPDEPVATSITSPAITQAVLMLAAFWYEQRETAAPNTFSPVPFGFQDLLQSYRKWVV
jgi:hypothetical protein